MYLETLCFGKFNWRALVRCRDPHLRGVDRIEAFERVRHPWGVFNDNNKECE